MLDWKGIFYSSRYSEVWYTISAIVYVMCLCFIHPILHVFRSFMLIAMLRLVSYRNFLKTLISDRMG